MAESSRFESNDHIWRTFDEPTSQYHDVALLGSHFVEDSNDSQSQHNRKCIEFR
jgi:hypothetical protein